MPQVINAGVPFDTTAMMLRRLDRDVPRNVRILRPGCKRCVATAEDNLRHRQTAIPRDEAAPHARQGGRLS